jgi:hypothetical protein
MHFGPTILTTGNVLSDQAALHGQQQFSEWDNQRSLLDSSHDLGVLDDWTLQSINEDLFGSLFSSVGDQDRIYDSGLSGNL